MVLSVCLPSDPVIRVQTDGPVLVLLTTNKTSQYSLLTPHSTPLANPGTIRWELQIVPVCQALNGPHHWCNTATRSTGRHPCLDLFLSSSSSYYFLVLYCWPILPLLPWLLSFFLSFIELFFSFLFSLLPFRLSPQTGRFPPFVGIVSSR